MADPPPTPSIKRAIAFGISLVIVFLWTWFPIFRTVIDSRVDFSFLGLVGFLIAVSLQAFLAYRLLAALRLASSLTDRLDATFYEDRRGSLALIVMSAAWGLLTFSLAALSAVDLILPGGRFLDPTGKFPPVGRFFVELAAVFSPFVCAGLLAWSGVTAARALWRVTAPSKIQVEEMPLASDEEEGEWDGWKDNRG
ncbi:hypothetical protein ACRE_020360 [Hapsidospora chrysogenum ATCC 11550]|uniref:Uncharacterized protein n=1 Tax=Hapsidospora chrysogenum (strain ATCC 11550 / CBS 779.69 / DSM 880 / IAM 14645 / JCM 23072 / IMI 49137) TaxID=857340 RepID=A0A086TCL8_HAPC1|nr:hypothetical protein ACRE_020360 [Hapsidospora chrysogenum ATCC 11550]